MMITYDVEYVLYKFVTDQSETWLIDLLMECLINYLIDWFIDGVLD